MFNHKLSQKFLTLLGAIGFGLLITPNLVLSGQAQSDSQPTTSLKSEIAGKESKAERDFSPPNRGGPETTAEGGSRGCLDQVMTILVPDDGNQMNVTFSEYPTLTWYFNPSPPEAKSEDQVKALKLVLIDFETGKEYAQVLPLPSQVGIVSWTLSPEDGFPALEKDKYYQWFINAYNKDASEIKILQDDSAICDYRNAAIERQVLTPEQQQELDSLSTAEERLSFYFQNEIWYDALATLDQMRRENPDDPTLNEQWRETLESIKLGELADQPPTETIQIVRDSEETANH